MSGLCKARTLATTFPVEDIQASKIRFLNSLDLWLRRIRRERDKINAVIKTLERAAENLDLSHKKQ